MLKLVTILMLLNSITVTTTFEDGSKLEEPLLSSFVYGIKVQVARARLYQGEK